MKRAALFFLAGILLAQPVLAAPVEGAFANPATEARARALQRELRCLVCQGESLDESNAPLAADLRRLVRAHIAAGESDKQIKDYLVARYGDFILMQPPFQSDTYALWIAPFLVLVLGVGIAVWAVQGARRRATVVENDNISDC